MAGILHFAKGLHRAAIDRDAGAFDARAYRPLLLEGKTVCVVGAGGIGHRGRPALRRARHAGRRHPPPSAAGRALAAGIQRTRRRRRSRRFLPDSDFVVICCQWTPETTRLFNDDRFAAMKPGSVLVNVARGEIVDEEALADALRARSSARRGAATSMSANSSTRRRRGSGPIPGC